jgi:hypothetical protein
MNSNKMNVARIAPAIGMDNENVKKYTHVYIPRIAEHYTEDQVRYMFAYAGLAEVEYVDFVKLKPLALPKVIPGEELNKDKEKEVPKFSAFVSIHKWLTNKAVDEIAEKGSHKFYISSTSKEFWMLLPNNAPLARTKVNVHQLASYTDELYTKLDTVNDELKQHQYMLYEQMMRVDKQNEIIEQQTIQIKQLFNLCSFQNGQITELHNTIRAMLSFSPLDQEEVDTSLEPITLADLDGPESKPESKKRTIIDLTDTDDEEDEPEQPVMVDIKPENDEEADLLQKLSILPAMVRSVARDYAYSVETQMLEPVVRNQAEELEPLIADKSYMSYGLMRHAGQGYEYSLPINCPVIPSDCPVVRTPDFDLIADSSYEEDDNRTYAPVKQYVKQVIPEKDMKEVSRRLFSDGICNN